MDGKGSNPHLWQEIDKADCTVGGITVYGVSNKIQHNFSRRIPRTDCALTFVREGGYHYVRPDGTAFDCLPGEMSFLPRGSVYSHESLTRMSRMDVAYIMNRRIEQVEELRASSDITLTDAARSCGFEDPAYFFKVYRRMRNHAPGKME